MPEILEDINFKSFPGEDARDPLPTFGGPYVQSQEAAACSKFAGGEFIFLGGRGVF